MGIDVVSQEAYEMVLRENMSLKKQLEVAVSVIADYSKNYELIESERE